MDEKTRRQLERSQFDQLSSNIQPVKSGADFQADKLIYEAQRAAKEEALGKVGDTLDYSKVKNFKIPRSATKLLGAVPVLGGLASALSSGDASAAVPVLDAAESTGPQAGTIDDRLERGTLTPEDKQSLAMEQARRQALQGMK